MLRSAATSYYHADGLGSVSSLSNAAGALAQTYTFDSFGKLTNSSGSLTNPFRYTGREFDTETGLYYYRARYYDPSGGRFINEDPLEFDGGVNFYAYVRNEAPNLTDPTGQDDRCASWVPDWLCNWLKGPRPAPPKKTQPRLPQCICTRTIVKPVPISPTGKIKTCYYLCDCEGSTQQVRTAVLWPTIKRLPGCSKTENCPFRVWGDADTTGSLKFMRPDPNFPPMLEPPPPFEPPSGFNPKEE